MRDNLHEDLFADHAWLEMRKVLDREMPERKRRGFFWFWLLPALGLCTLLCRDTLPQSSPLQDREALKQPVAQVDKLLPATIKPNPNNELPSKNRQEVVASTPPVSNPRLLQPKLEAVKRSAVAQQHVLHIKEKPVQQKESSAIVLHQAEGTTNNASENAPLVIENLGAKLDGETPLERLDVAARIEQPRSFSLPAKVRDLEVPSQYPYPSSVKLRKEWWLEAGAQMSLGVSGFSGYRAGVTHALPLGRSKNRLWLGLAYSNTETSFLQRVALDTLQLQNSGSGSGVTNTGTKVGISLPGADQPAISAPGRQNSGKTVSSIQLQLLQFDVSLFHPLNHHLGINLGAGVQYLQGIKLSNQYLRSPYASQAEASLDFNTTGNGGNQFGSSNLSNDSFRTFGLSTQAALHFQFKPRWSTHLGLRHTLQHFTKEERLLLRPTWVDLGLRYRLW